MDPAANSMRDYVLGFYTDATSVALIRKRRPTWQAGKLNGIGGRVEAGESVSAAMAREFREETGHTDFVPWRLYCVVHNFTAGYRVWCFHAMGNPHALRTVTDEEIEVHPHDSLPRELVGKVRWLLPMALDRGLSPIVHVEHHDPEIGSGPDDDRLTKERP